MGCRSTLIRVAEDCRATTVAPDELARLREEHFAQPRPCLRASPPPSVRPSRGARNGATVSGRDAGRRGGGPGMERFVDRVEAGRVLARLLTPYAGRPDVVVLGLPRGGVPVAAEVAAALDAPLDVLVVRKLGLPGDPELAMGAVAGVGPAVEVVRNEEVLAHRRVGEEAFEAVQRREMAVLREREAAYRAGRQAVPVAGRTVVLVDDGLATGATVAAAVAAVRHAGPARVVVAVPVGPATTCAVLREVADEVVCARTPRPFLAVGQAYRDFTPTSDEEVRRLLHQG
jgi:putative phosphoribosyl transferase